MKTEKEIEKYKQNLQNDLKLCNDETDDSYSNITDMISVLDWVLTK